MLILQRVAMVRAAVLLLRKLVVVLLQQRTGLLTELSGLFDHASFGVGDRHHIVVSVEAACPHVLAHIDAEACLEEGWRFTP